MSAIKIEVLPTQIRRRGVDRPSSGPIWLELGGAAFPSAAWDDFAAVVLGAMAGAIEQLLEGSVERPRFSFMEGPFLVEMERMPDGLIRVRGLERRLDETGRDVLSERASTSVSADVLLETTARAAEDLFRACLSAGDRSRDVVRLGDLAAQLRLHTRPRA